MEKDRVLIVDDEPAILAGLWGLLAPDFLVSAAADAEEALAALRRDSVGVILSDYKLPGRDGLSLLIEVKRRRPEIIRVLMTAFADMELVVRALNEGEVHRFIAKPFKAAELRAMLGECAALARLSRQGPRPGGPRAVLVAHDSTMGRSTLQLLLSPAYEVLTTGNGIEAMNILARRQVDAIVLGVGLELLDGCTIAGYLRSEQKCAAPIVFWTTGASGDYGEYLAQCGADLVLDQHSPKSLQHLRTFLLERLG